MSLITGAPAVAKCRLARRGGAMTWAGGALVAGVAHAALTPNAMAQAGPISRAMWAAQPAVAARMRPHEISGIMVHHTSARQRPNITLRHKMRRLQRFSLRPGKVGQRHKPAWGDVPYHYYIDASGRLAEGRNLAYAGDTNTRYDTSGWVQIVVEGDFTHEQPNPRQLATLDRLTRHLKQHYAISGKRISGHNDHATTNCPGPNLKRYLPSLR